MTITKVGECRWDGDHEMNIDAEDIARMSEGFCCDCQILSDRDGGWSTCRCCGVGWRIEDGFLMARFVIPPPTNGNREGSDGE